MVLDGINMFLVFLSLMVVRYKMDYVTPIFSYVLVYSNYNKLNYLFCTFLLSCIVFQQLFPMPKILILKVFLFSERIISDK